MADMKYLAAISAILIASAVNADWKVGMPVCLTTACSIEGDHSVKGAQLAASDLNDKGGVLGQRVVLRVEDTAEATTAATAVTAYQKLRTDRSIQYFIGPNWTPAGLAIGPIAAKADIVITSPSLGVKDFSALGINIFNVNGPDEASSRYLAQLAFRKGWRKVGIFSSQQPWDSAQALFFEDEFKKMGGFIVSKQEALPDASDLRVEALRLVQAKPDAIFFSNISGKTAVSLMRLRELNYNGPKLMVWIDDNIVNQANGAAEGAISCNVTEPSPWFVEKFSSRYGISPERASYGSYDILMIYAAAIEKAKSFEPAKVIPFLAKTRHDGASGKFEFNELGDAVRIPVPKAVKDGKFVPYNE